MAQVHQFHGRFKAKTVAECWLIARRVAQAYQRKMNQVAKKHNAPRWLVCKAARDAADRVALKIKYGSRKGLKR